MADFGVQCCAHGIRGRVVVQWPGRSGKVARGFFLVTEGGMRHRCDGCLPLLLVAASATAASDPAMQEVVRGIGALGQAMLERIERDGVMAQIARPVQQGGHITLASGRPLFEVGRAAEADEPEPWPPEQVVEYLGPVTMDERYRLRRSRLLEDFIVTFGVPAHLLNAGRIAEGDATRGMMEHYREEYRRATFGRLARLWELDAEAAYRIGSPEGESAPEVTPQPREDG